MCYILCMVASDSVWLQIASANNYVFPARWKEMETRYVKIKLSALLMCTLDQSRVSLVDE